MVRVEKPGSKPSMKRKYNKKNKGSDDSDEDYMVEEEEEEENELFYNDDEDSEDFVDSLDGDELEENLEDWEEENEKKKFKKVVTSKAKLGSSKKRRIGGKASRKRERVSYHDKDSDVDESEESYSEGDESEESLDYFEEEEEEEKEVRKVVKSKTKMGCSTKRDSWGKISRKRKRVSYNDDDDDEDEDYEYDNEDDDEFTPEEVDSVDEEDDLPMKKKTRNKKVGRRVLRNKGSVKTRSRKRKSKVLKKPSGKKGRRKSRARKKVKCDDNGDFMEKSTLVREKSKKKSGESKKRFSAQSDSDFVTSGSDDFEFTISEEEREQVREAGELCKSLAASLRSSSSTKSIQENGNLTRKRKPPVRKGKEKVEDEKNEAVKQVCGICLSEEGKRTVRGVLNCCSHYFCFACIMEWSKVESRCPLCKQRFVTISKPARSNTGIDLRDVVMQVPERDQIYQPSEEEIRAYLDPYENVICTECHEGGDDNLMLLCDYCDSPAHTYCVGLGREVPEGNWYCEGCRPVALGSSESQRTPSTPGVNMSHRSFPPEPSGQGFESLSLPSPLTPFSRGFGSLSSPRYPVGDVQAASPRSGAGATTLSGRRWIHRHIHSFIANNRMRQMVGRTDETSAVNLGIEYFNTQSDQGRESAYQHTRTPEAGTSYYNFFAERLQENPSPVQNGVQFPSTSSNFRRQVVQEPIHTNSEVCSNGALRTGVNSTLGHAQLHQCSGRSSTGSDGNIAPIMLEEGTHFYIEKEQVQSMVKSHLKSMSRDIGLGHDTLKQIARSSTHTILATCGLEHRTSEVFDMQPPPLHTCSHVETMTDHETSLKKGYCSSCFDSLVRNIVKTVMKAKLPGWLQIRD